jgi:hypothetical protein
VCAAAGALAQLGGMAQTQDEAAVAAALAPLAALTAPAASLADVLQFALNAPARCNAYIFCERDDVVVAVRAALNLDVAALDAATRRVLPRPLPAQLCTSRSVCVWCGASPFAAGVALSACPGCQCVAYCSATCFKADALCEHARECGRTRPGRAPGTGCVVLPQHEVGFTRAATQCGKPVSARVPLATARVRCGGAPLTLTRQAGVDDEGEATLLIPLGFEVEHDAAREAEVAAAVAAAAAAPERSRAYRLLARSARQLPDRVQRAGEADMQRTQADAARAEATSAAAELVAPLVQLSRAAENALHQLRYARGLELRERALAVAEALPLLPCDSLVTASLLFGVIATRTLLREDVVAVAHTDERFAVLGEAWRADAHALHLAQRALALYHARWRAGTLFALRPEERAFLDYSERPVQSCAEDYLVCANTAVCFWPPLRTPTEEEARVRGVYGALRAALEMDSREDLASPCTTSLLQVLRRLVITLADNDTGELLRQLRSKCGLSEAEWNSLCRLTEIEDTVQDNQDTRSVLATFRRRAAADVARHGLRRCALPSCGATEPAPKTYKLCGRCRGAAYCCAAHSKEDWKRHKREDDCQATD